MEHSFEEGVMCGMLLSGNNKSSSSSAKNQILKAVDENGIPIATFKITERYKLVCMAYYNNTYRLPNITPQLLKSRVDDTIIKPYAKPSDASSCAFPDSHIETYPRPCEGIYIFNVMYDNDKPMWATSPYRFVVTRNVSTKWIYADKRKSGFIKYPDDYAVNVKYDYCKEFVYWYRESYKFLLDKIEYKGNYTFDADLLSRTGLASAEAIDVYKVNTIVPTAYDTEYGFVNELKKVATAEVGGNFTFENAADFTDGYFLFDKGELAAEPEADKNDGVADKTTDSTASPKTGDVAPIAALAVVMMGAFGAMVVASKKRA